ncbi:MAG: TetR/AcrR family transcriptional regulator [Actinomycetota bacterium]|nr:TetR/AcrR family transcriptional regulator [Actinomycetota bacterium]
MGDKGRNRDGKGRSGGASPNQGNTVPESTRERILGAATRVFSRHPYRAASTRMIAAEAGVDHPLIHYYFGSKEKLFEEVTSRVYRDAIEAAPHWLEGTAEMSPEKGLSTFIDRFLDYYMDNPGAQQIIFVNMAQAGGMAGTPGYRYIMMHLEETRRLIQERMPIRGDQPELEMFVYCFHLLADCLLGAGDTNAQILGMDPENNEYRGWVKGALMFLFLPQLKGLIFENSRVEDYGPKR